MDAPFEDEIQLTSVLKCCLVAVVWVGDSWFKFYHTKQCNYQRQYQIRHNHSNVPSNPKDVPLLNEALHLKNYNNYEIIIFRHLFYSAYLYAKEFKIFLFSFKKKITFLFFNECHLINKYIYFHLGLFLYDDVAQIHYQ